MQDCLTDATFDLRFEPPWDASLPPPSRVDKTFVIAWIRHWCILMTVGDDGLEQKQRDIFKKELKSCLLPSPRPPPPPSPPHPPAPRHPLWWPQHIWNIPKQSRASWAPWKHIWNRSLTSQNNWNTSKTSQNNWRKAAHGVQAVLPQTILINFCQKIWGSLCPL